jgi:16S rRNA (cytosine967-C5)-methyltransferase
MHPKEYLEDTTALLALALKFDQPLDALVGQFFNTHRRAGSREREGISSAVYTVIRQRRLVDHLAQLAPPAGCPLQRRQAILGIALHQLALGENSPLSGSKPLPDVVHGAPLAVPPATKWDWQTYLQASLIPEEKVWLTQCLACDRTTLPDACRHNLPDWLADRLRAQLGASLTALTDALLLPAPLDLRVNTLKAKRKDVLAHLEQAHISTEPTAFSPWGIRLATKIKLGTLEDFNAGAIEVQDEGSQLLALLLDAKRGETVVDFCAGAGGKTLAIGAMMRNSGRLYAFDTSAHRLEGLGPRLAKSGLSNVHTMAIAHERDERLARLHNKVSRVLVDAPCSGLGTLRRHPALKWRQTPKGIEELTALQSRILTEASRLLEIGGRLVYATCSLLTEENEAIAEQFGRMNRGFNCLPVAALLDKAKVGAGLTLCSPGPTGAYLRLWPHLHPTDGFFAAVWERTH